MDTNQQQQQLQATEQAAGEGERMVEPSKQVQFQQSSEDVPDKQKNQLITSEDGKTGKWLHN